MISVFYLFCVLMKAALMASLYDDSCVDLLPWVMMELRVGPQSCCGQALPSPQSFGLAQCLPCLGKNHWEVESLEV